MEIKLFGNRLNFLVSNLNEKQNWCNMFLLQSSSKSKKNLKIYCLASKHNHQKNTFDSTNIWVSWPMNTRKPGKTVGPALKAVSNIQTNPINLYKTFLMANMKHKPCNLWHQHCFSFPTFPLFHHIPKPSIIIIAIICEIKLY